MYTTIWVLHISVISEIKNLASQIRCRFIFINTFEAQKRISIFYIMLFFSKDSSFWLVNAHFVRVYQGTICDCSFFRHFLLAKKCIYENGIVAGQKVQNKTKNTSTDCLSFCWICFYANFLHSTAEKQRKWFCRRKKWSMSNKVVNALFFPMVVMVIKQIYMQANCNISNI